MPCTSREKPGGDDGLESLTSSSVPFGVASLILGCGAMGGGDAGFPSSPLSMGPRTSSGDPWPLKPALLEEGGGGWEEGEEEREVAVYCGFLCGQKPLDPAPDGGAVGKGPGSSKSQAL